MTNLYTKYFAFIETFETNLLFNIFKLKKTKSIKDSNELVNNFSK